MQQLEKQHLTQETSDLPRASFLPPPPFAISLFPEGGLFGNLPTLDIISRINLLCPRGFVCFVVQTGETNNNPRHYSTQFLNMSDCSTILFRTCCLLKYAYTKPNHDDGDDDDDDDDDDDASCSNMYQTCPLLLLLVTCVLFPELVGCQIGRWRFL